MPLTQNVPGWTVVDGHHLLRSYTFPNFRKALDFVNRVGDIAEQQGHHPDIFLAWGKVELTIFTHTINGLSDSDFALARQVNQLSQETNN